MQNKKREIPFVPPEHREKLYLGVDSPNFKFIPPPRAPKGFEEEDEEEDTGGMGLVDAVIRFRKLNPEKEPTKSRQQELEECLRFFTLLNENEYPTIIGGIRKAKELLNQK